MISAPPPMRSRPREQRTHATPAPHASNVAGSAIDSTGRFGHSSSQIKPGATRSAGPSSRTDKNARSCRRAGVLAARMFARAVMAPYGGYSTGRVATEPSRLRAEQDLARPKGPAVGDRRHGACEVEPLLGAGYLAGLDVMSGGQRQAHAIRGGSPDRCQ